MNIIKQNLNPTLLTLFFLALFTVSLAITVSGCGDGSANPANDTPSASEVAEGKGLTTFQPFTVTTFDGASVDIAKLRGSVVLVNFWASWCGPCNLEARDLEEVYQKYQGKGVKFLGVAIDDTDTNARAFIKRFNLSYPNALDKGGKIATLKNIFAIPTTYVLDKDGLIVLTHRGAITKEQLSKIFDELL